MAVRLGATKDIPANAIILTEEEAALEQWKFIRSWPYFSQAWPIRLGLPLLAVTGTVGGLTINTIFRQKLKLRRYGKLTTSFIMGLAPAAIITGTHSLFVTNEIFLNRNCYLCLQQKAVGLQLLFGVIHPLLISPWANLVLSTRCGSYRIPDWRDYRGTARLLWKFLMSYKERVVGVIVLQVVVASFITYNEIEAIANIQLGIQALEAELLEEKAQKKTNNSQQ